MSTAKHKDLDTAVLIWFKKARLQNAPDLYCLKKQMNWQNRWVLNFWQIHVGWSVSKKERTLCCNIYGEANVLSTMTIDWLHSMLSSIIWSKKMSLLQMKLACFTTAYLKDSCAQEEKSRKNHYLSWMQFGWVFKTHFLWSEKV